MSLASHKGAGLAIILGVILAMVASLITPGVIIDSVDQTDFPEAIEALADNSLLTHASTLIYMLGIVLQAFGLFAVFRTTEGRTGLANSLVRFGVVAAMVHYGIFIIALTTRHMTAIVLDHGVGLDAAQEETLALTLHGTGAALQFGFLAISGVSSMILGAGLAARFGKLDLFKGASLLFVLTGLVALLNVVIGQHAAGDEFEVIAIISIVFLWVAALCVLIFGIGVWQGRDELVVVEDDA